MAIEFPITADQVCQIKEDLAEIEPRVLEMSRLLLAGCGEMDQRAIRAGELLAAIQHLQWALDRAEAPSALAARS